MAEYEVSNNTSGVSINFDASGDDEILQNVAMIIASVMYSCPMDREFAWDAALLDRPINIVKSLLASRLISAITKYEPRVQVVSVTIAGEAEGKLAPVVKVRILDG